MGHAQDHFILLTAYYVCDFCPLSDPDVGPSVGCRVPGYETPSSLT